MTLLLSSIRIASIGAIWVNYMYLLSYIHSCRFLLDAYIILLLFQLYEAHETIVTLKEELSASEKDRVNLDKQVRSHLCPGSQRGLVWIDLSKFEEKK